MKYYARYNTADPRIGAVSAGEVLEDWQVKALGESKVKELVADGLLKAVYDAPETVTPAADHSVQGNAPAADAEAGNGEEKQPGNDGEEDDEDDQTDDGGEEDDEEAEIPGDDDMSDIVPEESKLPATEKASKRGRGKKKNEGKEPENREG